MGHCLPLFVYFRSFHILIQWQIYNFNNINWKSVDGVLGTQTWDGRMEGADESTELWRHPLKKKKYLVRVVSVLEVSWPIKNRICL